MSAPQTETLCLSELGPLVMMIFDFKVVVVSWCHDFDHGRDYYAIVMISSPTFNDLKEKSTGSDKLRGSDLKKKAMLWADNKKQYFGADNEKLPQVWDLAKPVILVEGVALRNTFCIADCVLRVGIIHPLVASSSIHFTSR